ncbi:MAG: 50S ribosomal protein L10 [Candidatus Colwellbacteria bacterium RIFCSPLOWO2_12_FULL_44_13]|uniref:Large ribosomal subunit protein uL10 n=3 Tax=Candidatus Colwelliibacteriota TaxID=1817904 RepID=A0A1G1Z5Z8_9BACT|nr:MAG: 50S ribosomal protein L10 [Candidatus Colwellbacteria bacterium RIFCSPHIGHO2_12_FULL_44_17]OGY59869.1 MAG: 50S ribosomal protein L10 [Candidatus Colwellbacteria bacterium RIFCSPLOWO2_02_FULL_44_20b]OGY61681.1 MAG: 50S ribosomal protein L10 [Candidatus Colwellbacteria bacterium RIFCSPLOWO2_12_FULL_44_13]
MKLTKAQKVKKVEEGTKELKNKQTLVFVDFSGTKVEELKRLRRTLTEAKAKTEVIKKRLLRIMLKNHGANYDPMQTKAQVITVFGEGDISSVAAPIYKFSKELTAKNKKETFKVVGGYDLVKNVALSGEEVTAIGKLPSREVLIAQVVGTLAAPIRAFLYILSEKAKQSALVNKQETPSNIEKAETPKPEKTEPVVEKITTPQETKAESAGPAQADELVEIPKQTE